MFEDPSIAKFINHANVPTAPVFPLDDLQHSPGFLEFVAECIIAGVLGITLIVNIDGVNPSKVLNK